MELQSVFRSAALRTYCLRMQKEGKQLNNYNIYTATEAEKHRIMNMIRAAGAKITGVSGCGSGYYIQLEATPAQVYILNKTLGETA